MRLTLDRLWVALAIALPTLVALLVPLPAVDLAYQVRAGDEILRTGALPAVDSYTFTIAGAPWTDQQWLAQVILAAVHQVGGWELLAVLRAALVVSITGLLVAASIARGAAPRTGAVLSLLAFLLLAPALALRPQLFGIVIFVALLLLTALRHRRPSMFLGAPLLVVLWANVHGSFVLAPLLLGYAWLDDLVAGRPARRSLAVLVVGHRGDAREPVRPDGLELRGGDRGRPDDQRAGQRMAADEPASRSPACCSTHPPPLPWPWRFAGARRCAGRTGCGSRGCS